MAQLFKQNLATPTSTSPKPGVNTDGDSVVTMTQDLLQILLPFLGNKDSQSLFELSSTENVLESKHTGVQKRGYKILGKLVDSRKLEVTPESFIQQLESKVGGLSAGAKKVCVHCNFVPLVNVRKFVGSTASAWVVGRHTPQYVTTPSSLFDTGSSFGDERAVRESTARGI